MKKCIKLLLASSCLMFIVMAPVTSEDFNANIYALEEKNLNTEEVINELFEEGILASYGTGHNLIVEGYSQTFNNLEEYNIEEIRPRLTWIISGVDSGGEEAEIEAAISQGYMQLLVPGTDGLEVHTKTNDVEEIKVENFKFEEEANGVYSFSVNSESETPYNYLYLLEHNDYIYSIKKGEDDENGQPSMWCYIYLPLEDEALDPIKESLNYSIEDFNIDGIKAAEADLKLNQSEEEFEKLKAEAYSMLSFEGFSLDYYINASTLNDKVNAIGLLEDEYKIFEKEVKKLYSQLRKLYDNSGKLKYLVPSDQQYNFISNEQSKIVNLIGLDHRLRIKYDGEEHVLEQIDKTKDALRQFANELAMESINKAFEAFEDIGD